MNLDDSVQRLDEHLAEHPDVTVRIAWRVVRSSARRARRLSSSTLPRVAGIAQHAIAVREALDRFIPALPPAMFQAAAIARDHVLAIIAAMSTGGTNDLPDDTDSIG